VNFNTTDNRKPTTANQRTTDYVGLIINTTNNRKPTTVNQQGLIDDLLLTNNVGLIINKNNNGQPTTTITCKHYSSTPLEQQT